MQHAIPFQSTFYYKPCFKYRKIYEAFQVTNMFKTWFYDILMKILFYFKCKHGVPNLTTDRTTGCPVKKA